MTASEPRSGDRRSQATGPGLHRRSGAGAAFPSPTTGLRWTAVRPERQGSLRVRRDPRTVVMGLAGEADFTNHDQLLAALAEAVSGDGDIYLDVTELSFVDVAATRALLAAAANLPLHRRMVLIEPCHALRVILSSAGFQVPRQLVLVGSQKPMMSHLLRNHVS